MAYERALQALADPTRRAVFEQVQKRPASVGDIARRLPVSRPAVSQHLKVLKDAGLVSEKQQGVKRIYGVELSGLLELRRYLERSWDAALEGLRGEAEKGRRPRAR